MTKRKTSDFLPKGMPPRYFVEAGQRFGAGVVINPDIRMSGSRPNRNIRGARLICDCGNEYDTWILNLVGADAGRRGGKSCGCTDRRLRGRDAPRFVDRTGQRYGALVAVDLAEPRFYNGRPHTYWLCRCDCGNETTVNASSLRRGATQSCGCQNRVPRLAPGVAARNRVLQTYIRGSVRQRGLCWELTDEDFDRLTAQDCFYCGIKPSAVQVAAGSLGEFIYNGLDRKDNSVGYTAENVVPCCKACNIAKMDRPFDEFMAWIARLTEYHWFHPELTPSRLLKSVV
jgi:hypothetical protein